MGYRQKKPSIEIALDEDFWIVHEYQNEPVEVVYLQKRYEFGSFLLEELKGTVFNTYIVNAKLFGHDERPAHCPEHIWNRYMIYCKSLE